MMSIEIRIPTKASMLTPVKMKIMAARSVDDEISESLRASLPEAISESESSFSPFFLVYSPRNTLTKIATVMIISETAPYSGVTGLMIF